MRPNSSWCPVAGSKTQRFRMIPVVLGVGVGPRDLALSLGRRVCGLSLVELSRRVQIQSVSAATAVRRLAEKAKHDRKMAALLHRAIRQLHNE